MNRIYENGAAGDKSLRIRWFKLCQRLWIMEYLLLFMLVFVDSIALFIILSKWSSLNSAMFLENPCPKDHQSP